MSQSTQPQRSFQVSIGMMMLMMVVFAVMSAGLFYASRVPAVRDEIAALLQGKATSSGEDVGRKAHIAFIMFTFTSPLILAGALSTGMSILRWFEKPEMKSRRGIVVAKSTIVDALGSLKLPDSELDEFADALIRPHPSVLRFRRDADVQDTPCRTDPIPWYSLARKLHDQTIQPSRFLAYACRDYFLQDAGSLLALAACDADGETVPEPLLICDLCAAPGGKATALLEMLGDRGFLVANELIRSRVAPLAYNLARTGSDRYAITSLDPDRFVDHASGMFDLVLVDAPCSGQALLARGQQSESSLSPRQIEHSAARQRRILHAATQLLRSGGLLIYSTCTFATTENEIQIQSLIDQEIVEPSRVDRLDPYTSAEGCYRLWPHQHHCAGSFAASVRVRQGGSPGVDVNRKSRKPKQRGSLPDEAQQWFEIDDQALRLNFGNAVVHAWPADVPDWITELAVAGPELIHRTGRTWKPSHASAIRRSGRSRGLRDRRESGTSEEFSGRATDPVSHQRLAYRAAKWSPTGLDQGEPGNREKPSARSRQNGWAVAGLTQAPARHG